jgi:hypothetical protein
MLSSEVEVSEDLIKRERFCAIEFFSHYRIFVPSIFHGIANTYTLINIKFYLVNNPIFIIKIHTKN